LRELRSLVTPFVLISALFLGGEALGQCTTPVASAPTDFHTNDLIWFDDAFPAGSSVAQPGPTWSTAQAASGTQSFLSPGSGSATNQESFIHSISPAWRANAGDKFFIYVLIDPCATTQQLAVTLGGDNIGRKGVYWGTNSLGLGANHTRLGDLPAAGEWTRLEIPVETIGFTGKTVKEWIIDNFGGRVWWDRAGKKTPVYCETVAPAATDFHEFDQVYWDDAFPAGINPGGAAWSTTQKTSGTQSFHSSAGSLYFLNETGLFVSGLSPAKKVHAGDTLFAYVMLDPCAPARQIYLLYASSVGYKVAYWGENAIGSGTAVRIGDLPQAGVWTRLEVPAETLGLAGKTFSGISFGNYAGRVYWDRPGKKTAQSCTASAPAPTDFQPRDVVIVDDALPAGASWVGPYAADTDQKASGTQSFVLPQAPRDGPQEINLTGIPPVAVGTWDSVFVYARIDPCNPTRQILLTWATSSGWKSAYWGENPYNTTAVRIGDLPPVGQWARLEVPGSVIGLSGKSFTQMLFDNYDGRVWYDRVGKRCVTPAGTAVTGHANDLIWWDDAFPAGAGLASPAPAWSTAQAASGTQSFIAGNAGISGNQEIFVHSLNPAWRVNAGDKLFVYAFIDPCEPTQQLALTWGGSTIGRKGVYWGNNPLGLTAQTRLGDLPAPGQWARLEVPAETLGMVGYTAHELILDNYGGRVWWDRVGKQTAVLCSTTASAATDFHEFDQVYFDDSFPAGASPFGNASWNAAQKTSGTHSFVAGAASLYSLGQTEVGVMGIAPAKQVNAGDTLFAYVLVDPCAPTKQIFLLYASSDGYKTAYWGENALNSATAVRIGDLPQAGVWTRLEVPAATLGLAGKTFSGISFGNFDGRVYWDRPGKKTFMSCTAASSAPTDFHTLDVVYIDDAAPAGGSFASPGVAWDTVHKASGTQAFTHAEAPRAGHQEIYLSGITTPQAVAANETVFLYARIDPCNPTRQIVVTWLSNSGWKSAYWGDNPLSTTATRIGDLPASGQWARLEVPAEAIDMAGRTYNGLLIGTYDGRVWFDRAGKRLPVCSVGTPPASLPGSDGVWLDDVIPSTWTTDAPGVEWETANKASGTRSYTSAENPVGGDHVELFTHGTGNNPAPSFYVNPGDKLLAYVFIESCLPVQEIGITWTTSAGYKAAYWGTDVTNEAWAKVRIGDLPPTNQWVRLEVPAETVGVAGTWVNGLLFMSDNRRVLWDRAGRVCPAPAPAAAPSDATETIWIDDAPPSGATSLGDATFSSSYAAKGTQSLRFEGGYGVFSHEINGASATFSVAAGESLIAYMLANECNVPKEIVLSWHTTSGQWKRVFWGNDTLYGRGLASELGFFRAGDVPTSGDEWVRLTVNPERLGLAGATIDGFKIEIVDGQAWFDRIGKVPGLGCSATYAAPASGYFWEEELKSDDALPSGATASGDWQWTTAQRASGTQSHTDGFAFGAHDHSFSGANIPLGVGDWFSVWVLVSPCDPIRQVWIGANGKYVYWGLENIANLPNAMQFQFPLPQGQWTRFDVPAAAFDLEGGTLSDLEFGSYDGQVWFDRLSRLPAWADVTAVTTSPAAPVTAGTSVTITATATAGRPPAEYYFALRNNTTGALTQIQNWSNSSTATFTPSAAGNFSIRVYVQNSGSLWGWEDYMDIPFTVSP
jgi:hypothetical protein